MISVNFVKTFSIPLNRMMKITILIILGSSSMISGLPISDETVSLFTLIFIFFFNNSYGLDGKKKKKLPKEFK